MGGSVPGSASTGRAGIGTRRKKPGEVVGHGHAAVVGQVMMGAP